MPQPLPEARPSPPRRAAVVNLGCKVNQSEMEAAGRLLRERGVTLVDDRAPADLVLVNTCTVTSVADHKSRQAVRRARRRSPDARILVTGCSVQVQPEAYAAVDPDARLIGNGGKARLLGELAALAGLPDRPDGALAGPLPTLSGAVPVGAAPSPSATALPGIDGISDGRTIVDRTRAFVKVQDGCSFYCTYCIIPRARGAERSLPPEAVLADIRRALDAGHREVVLTGINIGTYDGGASERGFRGAHAWSALTLAGLVRRILDETDVERIRLSSIEPQHVDDDLLAAWTGSAGRCLPHFHLPLQSGDDGVLRRMGRRYDSAGYAATVRRIREAIPDVAIHADVMVGFPTEDEDAFATTVRFLERLAPAGLHVFRYSERPGTAAVRMTGHVDEKTRKARAASLLALASEARARFARASVGRRALVLFEERLADGRWLGHAEDHVLVSAASPDGRALENEIALVGGLQRDVALPDRLEGSVLGLLARPARRRRAGRSPRALPVLPGLDADRGPQPLSPTPAAVP